MVVDNVETTHCLIFKQDEVSIKAIYMQRSRNLCLCLFGNFMNQRARLSRIGFIQIQILISRKTYSVQTGLTKTKEIQRDDGQERKDLLDNCPTFKARNRRRRDQLNLQTYCHAALTTSLSRHRWKYSFKENQPVS